MKMNKILDPIRVWWEGKFVHPTEVERKQEGYNWDTSMKYPWPRKALITIGRFWLRRWPILLPIIITAIVALFIHFDSKFTRDIQQKKENTITNYINTE